MADEHDKPQDTEDRESPDAPPQGKRTYLGSFFDQARQVGRDVVSVAVGRWLEGTADEAEDEAKPDEAEKPAAPAPSRRVNMLHHVTEQLRGAADTYLAAKLDEIEARVDEKLDGIEGRIDRKIEELHEQLSTMRDRELQHRLRLLKFTLIFTVFVALLSLAYKWIEKFWLT